MDLQRTETYGVPISNKNGKSIISDNLVKSAIFGGILGGAGYILYRLLKPLTHTIPPIIIKAVGSGGPIEFDTEEELEEARALSEKVQYTMDDFKRTRWVEVRMQNNQGKWVGFGFGDESGLEVNIDLQAKVNGHWVSEPKAVAVDGKSENFPLTTEELEDNLTLRRYKKTFKDNKHRRIAKVEVVGFTQQPPDATVYKYVEVRFDDHIQDEK